MSENQIGALLRKYLEGRATSSEKKLIDEWYDSLHESAERSNLSEDERKALRKYYWESLKSGMAVDRGKTRRMAPAVLLAAASVSILVSISFFFFRQGQEVKFTGGDISYEAKHAINDTDSAMAVTLSDNSQVVLSPGTELEYPVQFSGSTRKVRLSGEALFDIERDETKPFYVYARDVVTKVLGTSFQIKAYPGDEQVRVSVLSGKVSVYRETESEDDSMPVVLTPNQEAVYSPEDQKVARTIVSDPKIIISDEEVMKIHFEGAPVSEIFKALERMYGITIVFDESKFSDCTVTTSINGKDLYERIDVICEITGASYTTQDTTIVIHGTGC